MTVLDWQFREPFSGVSRAVRTRCQQRGDGAARAGAAPHGGAWCGPGAKDKCRLTWDPVTWERGTARGVHEG